MDNRNEENLKVSADTAEAEKEVAAPVLGKFKDVKTLMQAYSDLEAEFTRRSKRLKELEQANKDTAMPDGAKPDPSPNDEDILAAAKNSEKVKNAIIEDYLKKVVFEKSVPLAVTGGGVSAPKTLPKTISEAGKLAQEFLNKSN